MREVYGLDPALSE